MTISYFIPLVNKTYTFRGDDEVVPSIDPVRACQGFPFTYIHWENTVKFYSDLSILGQWQIKTKERIL